MIDAATTLERIAHSQQRDVTITALVRRGGEDEVGAFYSALEMFNRVSGRDDGIGRSLAQAARSRIAQARDDVVGVTSIVRDIATLSHDEDVQRAALERLSELTETLELVSQAQMVAVL